MSHVTSGTTTTGQGQGQGQGGPTTGVPSPAPSMWTESEVSGYLTSKGHNDLYIQIITSDHKIDGKALLLLTEIDLRDVIGIRGLGDLKRLMYDILELQEQEKSHRRKLCVGGGCNNSMFDSKTSSSMKRRLFGRRSKRRVTFESSDERSTSCEDENDEDIPSDINEQSIFGHSLNETGGNGSPNGGSGINNGSPPLSTTGSTISSSHRYIRSTATAGGYAVHLKPELFKGVVAMAYLFVVTWITALVMVIVHDRVPDMEKYPPLPDLFLDNMPHIPWAFEMCEVTGTILLCLWLGVLFFHKHRFILIRRFFALSGTVFLLRCVTMLITSLSVPGTHLKCNPRPYGDWMSRLYNAYLIWKGAGMSIQGVRTCGDYMFSGHTVALTMLNFFVTEYTTRRLYFIHTFSWLLNMFGIFFILAAHEHYSIDVFIAFYITSRLFLYYHTLANNQALMQRDSKRTKVWFPLFSYFESSVDGIVPNHYEWPLTPRRVKKLFKTVSLAVERKYKGNFFTREGSSRGFGLFRTRVNAFIRPSVVTSSSNREKSE